MKREEILRRARKNKDNEFENRIKNRYFIFMGCVFGIFIVGIAVYLNSIGLSLQSNVLIVAANFLLFVGMPFYFFLIKKGEGVFADCLHWFHIVLHSREFDTYKIS